MDRGIDTDRERMTGEPSAARSDPGLATPPVGARLPTFLVIGAMKAGTTSLYHYLRSHPHVFMPDVKEVMFFDPRHNWDRGVAWYAGLFEAAKDSEIALGEASTSYTKFPVVRDVPARIASVLPEVRLVYLLRHPIERMQSHYLYALSRGKERRPIEVAFAQEPSYLDISRYAFQLRQYAPSFRPERFLFIDSRDLAADRLETLRRVFRFLGVDEAWVPPAVDREFFRSADRTMPPPLTQRLRRVPGAAALRRRVPRSIRSLSRKMPGASVDLERARISDSLRDRLVETLAEDVAELRRYLPEGFDGWGIA